MTQSGGVPVELSNGEPVTLEVVPCPNPAWADRLEALQAHKGEPWNWQNAQCLRLNLGFESRFHVLHRAGVPFASILLSERAGVGVVNHVWTVPEDRQKGASGLLMRAVMAGFRERGGEAAILQTEFGSTAFRLYEKHGFRSVEAQSGYMHWYADSEAAFNTNYFSGGSARTVPLEWRHWPTVQPLLQLEDACTTRVVALGHLGRRTTSDSFLTLLKDELESRAGGAASSWSRPAARVSTGPNPASSPAAATTASPVTIRSSSGPVHGSRPASAFRRGREPSVRGIPRTLGRAFPSVNSRPEKMTFPHQVCTPLEII